MLQGITWYTLDEAAAKYCLGKSIIERWVAQGIVRAEHDNRFILRVNIDDLGLRVQEGTFAADETLATHKIREAVKTARND